MNLDSGRKLSLRCAIVPGESFVSYLKRLCEYQPQALQVDLNSLLARCGLLEDSSCATTLPAFGIQLSADHLSAFANATRNTEEDVSRLLLANYEEVCLDLPDVPLDASRYSVSFGLRNWVHSTSTHCCPLCLKNGVEVEGVSWKLDWKLPWCFMCLEHGIFLVDKCSRCDKRITNLRTEVGVMPMHRNKKPQSGFCLNSHENGICQNFLPHLPSVPVIDKTLFEIQRLIQTVLSGQTLDICESTYLPKKVFQFLRSLMSMYFHVALPEDMSIGQSEPEAAFRDYCLLRDEKREQKRLTPPNVKRAEHRSYASTPNSPLLVAAILPQALEILLSADYGEMCDRMAPLAARARQLRGNFAWALAQDLHFDGCIGECFSQLISVNSTSTSRLNRIRLDKKLELSLDYIPALMLSSEFEQHFARFFSVSDMSNWAARAFVSVKFGQLTTGCSRDEAIAQLDLPQTFSNGTCNKGAMILKKGGSLDLFEQELKYLAMNWVSRKDELIDYKSLRSNFKNLESIDEDILKKYWGREFKVTRSRQRNAAAWVWSYLTQGHPYHSPALRISSESSDKSRRMLYLEFEAKMHSLNLPLLPYVKEILGRDAMTYGEHRIDREESWRIQ